MKVTAESVAKSFVRAINKQDVEMLAKLMTQRHQFVDSLGKVVEGRENARVSWGGYFRMVPDYAIVVAETICDGPVVVLLGVAQGTYTVDGWLRAENAWQTQAAFRAVVEDGKVAEWWVYADNEPLRERMKKNR
jgi:ketosteroid isomerase-like protein